MIKNKNQLKKALKEKKETLLFVTLKNSNKPELEGKERKANIVQTNAFTLLTPKGGELVDSWVYYKDIKVNDNIISYLDEHNDPIIEIKIIELE